MYKIQNGYLQNQRGDSLGDIPAKFNTNNYPTKPLALTTRIQTIGPTP